MYPTSDPINAGIFVAEIMKYSFKGCAGHGT